MPHRSHWTGPFHSTAALLQAISEWSGRAVSWLTTAMVAVTFLVVLLRYAFDLGWIAMQESVLYLHAAVFMVGVAYTFKHSGHVRVDIFYRRLSPQGQAWVNLAGTVCLLLPMCIFIVWISWEYVAVSWNLREGSRETGGLPGVYLLKSLLLVMPTLLALEGLAQALRSVLILVDEDTAVADQPDEPEV